MRKPVIYLALELDRRAGGDARSMGPSLEEEYTNDPECYTSGLEQASYAGNVEVLKKLKPRAERDDLEKLLHAAAISGRKDAIQYLLEIGAKANDQENGGSSALDTCLWRLSFGRFSVCGEKRLASKYDGSAALECVQELLVHGAVWNPAELTPLRRTLLVRGFDKLAALRMRASSNRRTAATIPQIQCVSCRANS